MMDRRLFMTSTASAAICTALPVVVGAEPVIATAKPALKWFAVSHSDEFCHPIRAYSMRQAIEEYAFEHGQTKGDQCPECEDYECLVHLTKDQWSEPLDCIAENSKEPKSWAGLDEEPTNAQWAQAGFNVVCDQCKPYLNWNETQQCYVHNGKALCDDCYHEAKSA